MATMRRAAAIPLRWTLPTFQLCVYGALVALSGWPRLTVAEPNPFDLTTPLSLYVAFQLNWPANLMARIVTASKVLPESFSDNVVLTAILLMPLWWMVGRWIETRKVSAVLPYSPMKYFVGFFGWAILCLTSTWLLLNTQIRAWDSVSEVAWNAGTLGWLLFLAWLSWWRLGTIVWSFFRRDYGAHT